jgi:hypothetical protein
LLAAHQRPVLGGEGPGALGEDDSKEVSLTKDGGIVEGDKICFSNPSELGMPISRPLEQYCEQPTDQEYENCKEVAGHADRLCQDFIGFIPGHNTFAIG